ncbi:hypothetical protein ACTWQB_15200 [Piscibacillus sp. B03]|uniref:hypothetical protein n=1 Tax=Piscibacillus sp. B03 TaxID=3457430 RepID=UPI003FCD1D8B
MVEERLEKMENMLVQLVQMVEENNQTTKELSHRVDGIENQMGGLVRHIDQLEEKNESRHQEHMNKFDEIKLDQDFIYEKTN